MTTNSLKFRHFKSKKIKKNINLPMYKKITTGGLNVTMVTLKYEFFFKDSLI